MGSFLFFVIGVENILMSPLLYVGVAVAYLLKVRALKFLTVFSILNTKWAIPLALCHFLNRLSFQGSFSPELWFIRCSRYASSKNRVKECSMECNLGLLQNKIHLFSRSCTFTPFSEPSLESKPCSIQSILIKTFVTTFIENLVFSIKNLPHKWISIDFKTSLDTSTTSDRFTIIYLVDPIFEFARKKFQN